MLCFRKTALSKKGSVYVEAALVMPMTCLIVISLITLMLGLYMSLCGQIEHNREKSAEIYQSRETDIIRSCDALRNGLKEAFDE